MPFYRLPAEDFHSVINTTPITISSDDHKVLPAMIGKCKRLNHRQRRRVNGMGKSLSQSLALKEILYGL